MKSLNTEDVDSMKKDFEEAFAMYQDDLGEHLPAKKHASLAHASEGTEAMKAKIIAKTKNFAEAMKSLNTEDVDSMKKDFEEAFAMYRDDLGEHLPAKKHASLAHASEGTEAMKADIIAKTKNFAEAMESLNTEDVHSMKKDFDEVFAMYRDDLGERIPAKKHASLAHDSEGTEAMKA